MGLAGQTHCLIVQQGGSCHKRLILQKPQMLQMTLKWCKKNVQCLLKFPSSSCLFLFLNVLSICNKYFFKPLLNHGLNPRARDEKEIWVKPCTYYIHSIKAQKSAPWHSSANACLTKAGKVFWKLSLRYINYLQPIYNINLRFKASLSLIEQTQTTNAAQVIFPIL